MGSKFSIRQPLGNNFNANLSSSNILRRTPTTTNSRIALQLGRGSKWFTPQLASLHRLNEARYKIIASAAADTSRRVNKKQLDKVEDEEEALKFIADSFLPESNNE